MMIKLQKNIAIVNNRNKKKNNIGMSYDTKWGVIEFEGHEKYKQFLFLQQWM